MYTGINSHRCRTCNSSSRTFLCLVFKNFHQENITWLIGLVHLGHDQVYFRTTVVWKVTWKERKLEKSEILKFPSRLETTDRSWQVFNIVLKFSNGWKLLSSHFSNCPFQLLSSNFRITVVWKKLVTLFPLWRRINAKSVTKMTPLRIKCYF